MSARILVVDDMETNRRLLEARLSAEYFEVFQADNGLNCIKTAHQESPDIILLDVMMPGMDGFETCRRLKDDPVTRHIPVIMVTALDQREDRIRGLEAGADDFLTKPVDDVALFARVRSLLRLKMVLDELRLRDGGEGVIPDFEREDIRSSGKILVVAGDDAPAQRLAAKISKKFSIEINCDPRVSAERAGLGDLDLLVVDLTTPKFDGLRLCARVRSETATRQLPILAIVDGDDSGQMVRALDLGVSDVVTRPVDGSELNARVRTQMRRKVYADQLRGRLEESLEMAVTDPLTGLHNRRYIASRLRQYLEGRDPRSDSVSVAILDIDHFKRINDTYGHQAGDDVLREFSERMRKTLRALELAGRFGGEEFVLVLPEAGIHGAYEAAERVRHAIEAEPFLVRATGDVIQVTVSAGVAEGMGDDTMEALLHRADDALYEAKAAGRNQVMIAKKKAA
ncbi:PleD family two-component system response regulator [Woodsholea maritima]|uniref:PleD family two-component system response regulator n=1 Tax=Woodsholea maritima TaxID=240237 RepID=UPI0003725CB7|nr:PleD family two-component system response regulator [Woodsholea maritima]